MTGRALAIGAGYVYGPEFFFRVAGKFAEHYGIDKICPIGGSAYPAIHRESAKEIVQCLRVIHHRRAKINKALRLAVNLEVENDCSYGFVAAGIEFDQLGFLLGDGNIITG
jgi:hypothetical protein